MVRFLSIFCVLLLVSCAPLSNPSSNNSNIPVTSEQANLDSKSEVCKLSKNIASETDQLLTTTSQAVDPQFENYIVKFKSSHKLAASGQARREYGVSSLNLNLVHGSTFTLKLSGSASEKKSQLESLIQQGNVDYIEPDYVITSAPVKATSNIPDDPYFAKQWFHKTLNSLSAWTINDGSEELIAAVIDTGIDYTHPDLKENKWTNNGEILNGKDDDGNGYIDDLHGWNFSANSNDARTTSSSPHGSHVAGLIGASGHNHLGVVGVAPKVKMMALKFMDDTGAGMTSNAIKAINYAIDKKVFLINNSWGSNTYSKALSEAIARAARANILFFAAAGNGSKGTGYNIDSKAWYPASYPHWNVFSVAATNADDQLTNFSNFSKTKVDVAAPGFSIFSTVSGSNYQMMSGTSMATPIVSGLAILIKATNPKLGARQIIKILRESSDKVPALKEKVISGGRINAYKAVVLADEVKSSSNCENL